MLTKNDFNNQNRYYSIRMSNTYEIYQESKKKYNKNSHNRNKSKT